VNKSLLILLYLSVSFSGFATGLRGNHRWNKNNFALQLENNFATQTLVAGHHKDNHFAKIIDTLKIDSFYVSIKHLPDSLKAKKLLDYYKKELKAGKYIKSIIILKKILETPFYVKDSLQKIKFRTFIENKLGQLYIKIGLYSKALTYSTKALIDAKKINDTLNIISSYIDISTEYYWLMLPNHSKQNIFKALKYAEVYDNKKKLSVVYDYIGRVYANEKKYDSARYYCNRANKIIKQYTGSYSSAEYNNIGDLYCRQGKLDTAIKYFNLSKKHLKPDTDPLLIATLNYNYSDAYFRKNQLDSAKNYAKQSLNISKRMNYYDQMIEDYKILALIFAKEHNFDSTILYQQKYTKLKDSIFALNQQTVLSRIKLLNDIKTNELEISKLKTEKRIQNIKSRGLLFAVIFFFIVAIIVFYQKTKIKKAYNLIVGDSILVKDLREEITNLRIKLNATRIFKLDLEEQKKLNETNKTILTDEQISYIEYKIRKAFDEDKVYLDKYLDAKKFAQLIGSNRSYVSYVLKTRMRSKFSDLLNTYRVNEAKKLLLQEDAAKYTLEVIALKAGFNSVTTFNRAFKKITGVTPSFFYKTAKKVNQL